MSTQPQPDNTNELTIQDLALMKGIIDIASECNNPIVACKKIVDLSYAKWL